MMLSDRTIDLESGRTQDGCRHSLEANSEQMRMLLSRLEETVSSLVLDAEDVSLLKELIRKR